jgi:putative methyltransferase (TIGR04325 family)
MKAAIRPFVPPILLERPRSGPTAGAAPASTAYYDFSDPFPTWADAVAASGGYDDPDILRRVRAAALKAKRGEIAYEQDSLEFAEPSPKWEMLACLMTALANSMNRPGHIIDFGGSLGTLYYRHRDFVRGVCWSIVEQPGFVKCGKAEFADQTLGFFSSVGEALERAPGDVLLVGCTLQVLEDPFAPIRQAAAAGVPYLLIDRHPLYDIPEDRIVVLTVKATVYPASYAYRQFAAGTFEAQLATAGYEVIQRYEREKRMGFLCRLA